MKTQEPTLGKHSGSILVNFTTAQSFELVNFELWDPPYHTKQEGRE